MIRLGTLFSGIGAIEQALIQLNEDHRLVFACDNGERELKLLDKASQKELDSLSKKTVKKLTSDELDRLRTLRGLEQEVVNNLADQIFQLPSKVEKKEFVDRLYAEQCKTDNLVQQTYFANYNLPEKDFHQDVHFLDGRDYHDQVDMMVGGSPCQSFSSNGKRGGFEDTRGTLFHEYARIISQVEPKCFIFENVKGMLVHDGGRTWETIKAVFRELNYNIYIHQDEDGNEQPLLNAKDYGIPQNRERIYLVGIRADLALRNDFTFPEPIPLGNITNRDFLEIFIPAKYYLGQKGFEFVTTHPTRAQVGRTIQKCQKANQQFNWNGDFIFEPLDDRHTPEILERAYVGEWNGQRGVIRMYTPRECLNLMGFPDDFVMPHNDNVMYRQSGNSIVVNVLMHIVRQLIHTGIFDL